MGDTPPAPRHVWHRLTPSLCVLGVLLAVLPIFFALVTTVSATPHGQFLQRGRPPYDYEASIQIIMDYARKSHEANDVIFLGGSTCRCGLQPILFEQFTGLRAYNLGLFGMMEFGGLEVVFRNYLKHHPAPRLLVLCIAPEEVTVGENRPGVIGEVYNRVFECFDDGDHTHTVIDPQPLIPTLRRDARYTYFIATRGIDGFKRVQMSGCSLNYGQFAQLITQGRGFLGFDGPTPSLNHLELTAYPFIYTSEACKGVAAIVRLAQVHGTKVIIRFSPLPVGTFVPHKTALQSQRELHDWSSGLDRYCPGVTISKPEMLFYDRSRFIDRMHVNRQGAILFTRFLADFVRRVLRDPPQAANH